MYYSKLIDFILIMVQNWNKNNSFACSFTLILMIIHLNLYRISMRVVFSYHSLQIFIYYNYTINIQNYKPLLSSGRQEAGCVGHLAVCLTAPISKFLGNVQHMVHTPHCLSEQGRPRISKQWEICRICSMFLTKT